MHLKKKHVDFINLSGVIVSFYLTITTALILGPIIIDLFFHLLGRGFNN
jgi:hypothetical protein